MKKRLNQKIWRRLFLSMATISVAFVLIIAAVNGGFFARGFTRYEKGLLRACADRAGEMDLDDREAATEGLRAMEDNYSVQFNLYENGKLIYATLGQSIYNRPGLTGFDVLTHADDASVVLDSDTDRFGGVFAEVQVRSGTEYIVYTRAYGERTVKVMIRAASSRPAPSFRCASCLRSCWPACS